MNTEKTEWLRRMGIDVWARQRPGGGQVSPLKGQDDVTQHKQSETFAKSVPNDTQVNAKIANSRDDLTSNAEKSTTQSVVETTSTLANPQNDTIESVKLRVTCEYSGRALFVCDQRVAMNEILVTDLALVVNHYKRADSQRDEFVWPPNDSTNRAEQSLESARRSFKAFVSAKHWDPHVLVVIGDSAKALTVDAISSKARVLQLLQFPKTGSEKQELWMQLQSSAG